MELKLGDVQTTALIPLAVKANETLRKNARIKDKKAVEIIKALQIDTAQYDKFMSHEGVIARTIMLDRQLRDIIKKHVQEFFNSVYRVLRPNGRLILRDMTMKSPVKRWFCNHIEMPLAHLFGKGDVRIYGREDVQQLCSNAGLHMELFEVRPVFRLHCVARKPK